MISITNMDEFKFDLKKFSDKVGVNFQTVLKRTALSIFSSIIQRTPVDTGVARASWVIGVNAAAAPANLPKDTKLSKATAGQTSTARAAKLEIPNPFSVVVISNYLPYINVLENGSSSQAPQGMVRLALAEEVLRLSAALRAIQ